MVIVIVPLAEELLALLTLLFTSTPGMLVSATEIAVSPSPDRNKPTNMTIRMIAKKGFFTSTFS